MNRHPPEQLFLEDGASATESRCAQQNSAAKGSTDHAGKIKRSALWAAYGDALGWISEITDSAGLSRRTGGKPLIEPIKWRRRIGGRSGVTVSLPQGCYSDDSQLRLATGRAIGSDGFDVEAFSKVELPVWLSYELGGGKSTKAAATNLSNRKVKWFANTYLGWAISGGNGAAMRIQPHVWSANKLENPETFLRDVIRNAVCTHSHPNGLLGACLHALTLAHTVTSGCHPTPDALLKAADVATSVPEIIKSNEELQYWLTFFERDIGPFASEWNQAIEECKRAIDSASNIEQETGLDRYRAIAHVLRLYDPGCRGSGLLTSIAAAALTWCESQPEEALRIAVNQVGTDTDTIATMAGAILGVIAESEPPIEVMNAELFRSEADRLVKIAQGGTPPSHLYPDLLHWEGPKTRSDTLKQTEDGRLYVDGLGSAEALSDPIESSDTKFNWQWIKLETGQDLLIKRRRKLACRPIASGPTLISGDSLTSNSYDETEVAAHGAGHLRSSTEVLEKDVTKESQLDLQTALEYVKEHIDNDVILGKAVRRVIRIGTTQQILDFMSKLVHFLGSSADDKQFSNH